MRKIILGTVLGLVFSIGAYTSAKAGNGFCEESDPCGVWVKIDASGLAISGAIACTPSVCGNPNGMFAQMTLNAGEEYVQQSTGRAGIGNNNPGTTVTYDRGSATWTIVNEAQPQPTAAAPQPTSEPSAPSAPQQPTGVEPTSGPQPAPEATSQPAPEATPAPPVVGQPTPTSVPPVAGQPTPTSVPPVVVAPTQTPEPVVPIIVPIVPTVDPNVIPNTYEWKLSDNNGEFRWQPKRRSPFSGEQQAI